MYTVSLRGRTLGVCSAERYAVCDVARRHLLGEGLLGGRVTLVDGPTGDELTAPALDIYAQCTCSCHCGDVDCDECYEDASPVVHTAEPADSCASDSDEETERESQEETLLSVWPAGTPDAELPEELSLRYTSDGNLEMLRASHREHSYYMFWMVSSVSCEVLGELQVRSLL